MKVLFFVYGGGAENGGHYYSLDQISRILGTQIPIGIVSIGPHSGSILTKNPYFLEHVEAKNFLQLLRQKRRIRKILRSVKADVLHFFDTESFDRILFLNSLSGFPVIMNKCGGRNPRRSNWHHVSDLILFSAENYEWFIKNRNYKNVRIHLIPNRVRKLEYLSPGQRTEVKDMNRINFVRVSRLGSAYEKTLMASFELIHRLGERYNVMLYVVGRIQNEKRFNEIRKYVISRSLPVQFITDERARQGSDFLYLADFVIGTGRSLMEALSLGIPCLTPATNSVLPILLDKSNFDTFFRTNFSERNVADSKSLEANFVKIIKLIESKEQYKIESNEMEKLFSDHFDIGKVPSEYCRVYQDSITNPIRCSLRRANLFYIAKLIKRIVF